MGYAFLFLGAVALGGLVACVIVLRIYARVSAREKAVTPDAAKALKAASPGQEWMRAEMAVGDNHNSDGATGMGALALYKQHLIFAPTGKKPFKLALADISDLTQVRAVSALGTTENAVDREHDYLLKVSWKGGEATFQVHDVEEWIAALAAARP